MPAFFPFEVHTPYRHFFSGGVEWITVTLIDGEIGVYANHSFFIAPTVSCILRFKDDTGRIHAAFVTEGILEVKEHKTVLMVEAAEWPKEINTERALAARQAAEESLKGSMLKFETSRAREKLRRAEFRLKAGELAMER